MFVSFLKMVIGAILVFSSLHLTMDKFRRLLERMFPGREVLHGIVSVATFIVSEMIGINLLIDPIVPGQAVISVHAEELVRNDSEPFDLRVEIAVANFGGGLDSEKTSVGKFDETGIYSVLTNFDWLQSYVQVRLYRQKRPDPPIQLRWEHITTWSRLGLTKEHIYISK